jgi:hypothetical protein
MAMESPGAFNQASSYSAEVARRAIFSAYARTAANTPGILAGGTLSASDLILSAPGSGLSVNVSTGEAIVGGSEGGVQGGYYARNASVTNLTISTANPTNPRIDTIALTIADSGYTEPTGVSGNAAVLQVITGTATSGANLTNLSGKAALSASSLLLGYVLVPATATNIITADIANKATVVNLGAAGLNYLQLMTPRTLRVAAGNVGVTFPASATSSATLAVAHGLGTIPTTVIVCANGSTTTGGVTFHATTHAAADATNLYAQGWTEGGTPVAGGGDSGNVFWLAIG